MEYRATNRLKLDIGRPDQFGPFLGEINDVFAELHTGTCENRIAELGNAPRDPGISKTGIYFLVELLDNLGRRIPRSADSVPPTCIIARHELGNAWNIWQCFCSRCAGHRKRAQFICLYVFG